MKTRIIFYCLFAALFTACNTSTPPVTFDTVIIKRSNTDDSIASYNIDISYLTVASASEPLKKNITDTTNKWLQSMLNTKNDSRPFETIIDSWVTQLEKDTIRLEDDEIVTNRYELTIYPDSVYQTEKVLSIRYSSYTYTGGAHGMEYMSCFNFDKKTGSIIGYAELVKDNKQLLPVAEQLFRKQQEIPDGQPLDEQYFFENGVFVLSNSFSFAADGIHFYYQPYEAAPYAVGIIELILPYSDIKGFVNYSE